MGQESLRTPRVRLPSSAKRPMSEIVNVVVAVAVIYFVARWATSSNETPEQRTIRTTLGFKPKKATREMVRALFVLFGIKCLHTLSYLTDKGRHCSKHVPRYAEVR